MGERSDPRNLRLRGEIPRRKHRLVAQGTLFRYAEREKGGRIYGICTAPAGGAPPERTDTGTVCRAALRVASGGEQVGVGPRLPGDREDSLYLQLLRRHAQRAVRSGAAAALRVVGTGAGARAAADGVAAPLTRGIFQQSGPAKQVAGRRDSGGRGRAGRPDRPVSERRKQRYGNGNLDRSDGALRRGGGRDGGADIHLVRARQRGRADRGHLGRCGCS